MFQRLMETAPSEAVPASTPASTPPPASGEAEAPASDVDYGQLTADIEAHDAGEDYSTPVSEPAAEPARSTEGAAVAAPPPALEPSSPTPVEAPAPITPAAPAAAVPSPEPARVASPPAPVEAPTPQVEPIDFEKQRKDFLAKTEQLYKLTDDEAEEARISPHEALPKLASRLHFEVQMSTFGAVMQALPQLITRAFQEREAQQKSESAFYTRWPDLNKPEYGETVLNSMRAYRAANPKAGFEEMVEKSGLFAMISLGLNPIQPPAPPPVPTIPQVPPRPTGVGASPVTPVPPGPPPGVDPTIAEMIEFELRENA